MIEIGPLRPEDRAAWEVLARGYKTFYRESEPDEAYEQTWQRLAAGTELHGLGARLDGRLAGIAHYLFHPACLVRRGLLPAGPVHRRGGARARRGAGPDRGGGRGGQGARGGPVLLAHPGEQHPGPRLYDKVARFTGFIRYAYPL